MTAAAWALAIVGLALVLMGAAVKTGNGPSLRAVAEDLAKVPASLRKVLQADADAHMLLGIGVLLMATGLLAFMLASVLP